MPGFLASKSPISDSAVFICGFAASATLIVVVPPGAVPAVLPSVVQAASGTTASEAAASPAVTRPARCRGSEKRIIEPLFSRPAGDCTYKPY